MNLAPLFFESQISGKWRKRWSGKEDSNLRPLPPEGTSPVGTRRFSVAQRDIDVSFVAVCSQHVPAPGSYRGFGPCLPAILTHIERLT